MHPLAVVGFFALYGLTNTTGRIWKTRYWSLGADRWYVAKVTVQYVVVGLFASIGTWLYTLAPSTATLVVAAVTPTVFIVTTVGKKWRRLLGMIVYERMDLASGPSLKQRLLDRVLDPLSSDSDGSSDGTDTDDPPTDSNTSGFEDTLRNLVASFEDVVGFMTAVVISLLVTIPYFISLSSGPSATLLAVWFASAVFLGGVMKNTQSTSGGSVTEGAGEKNVIFVMIDDLRRDRLSLYGYDRETTPFLDGYGNATVYENAVAPGTSSGHSTPSMLSGTFSSVHEYGHNLDLWLLPDAFDEAGYATGAISGNPHVTVDLFGDRFDWFLYLERGKRYLFEVQRFLTYVLSRLGLRHLPINYYVAETEHMNQLAKRFVDDHENDPFFLYLHYQDLHEPYLRELHHVDEFAESHGESVSLGDWVTHREGPRSEWYNENVKNWGYDEMIHEADTQLADLVQYLDDKNLLEETSIVVTSDHGELLGERDMWGHPDLPYNPLFEIPLVVLDEDIGNESIASPVSGVEVPKLSLDLADIDPGAAAQDQWLVDRDITTPPSEERPMLVDYFSHSVNLKGYDAPLGVDEVESQRMLVGLDRKLYEVNGDRRFFDYDDVFLDEPRTDTSNVAQEMDAELSAFVSELQSRMRSSQVTNPYADIDDERVYQQLEDLGYR